MFTVILYNTKVRGYPPYSEIPDHTLEEATKVLRENHCHTNEERRVSAREAWLANQRAVSPCCSFALSCSDLRCLFPRTQELDNTHLTCGGGAGIQQ